MLEVLIALIVLAVALLGHSKIQALGVRAGTNAHLKTEATFLANDMIERMRANQPSVDNDYYATGIDYGTLDCAVPPGTICSEGTAGAAADCNSAQIAEEDAWTWFCDVTNSLPGGTVAVSSAAGVFSVGVTWNDLDDDGVVVARTVSTTFIP